LSIARWIADAHRARIEVSSAERSGTRIEVTFPIATRDALGKEAASRVL
jgi:signal transduction histidine kinase